MLAHWFNRSGIGQLIAPDVNAPKTEEGEEDDVRRDILQLLAPDPNFAPAVPPPRQFQCQHCHKWTPVSDEEFYSSSNSASSFFQPIPSGTTVTTASTPKAVTGLLTPGPTQSSSTTTTTAPVPTTSNVNIPSTPFWTPSPQRHRRSARLLSPQLEQHILSAAKSTAEATFSPRPILQARDKLFRACLVPKMDDRVAKRFRSLILKDPSLLHSRASHLGELVPEGLTPLQAAANSGSLPAVELILELGRSCDSIHVHTLLIETDLKGRTALHIAAERGNVDIVQKLLPLYQLTVNSTKEDQPAGTSYGTLPGSGSDLSSPMPVDLLGRTPFGSAITSPNPTARKRKKELEKLLFSSTDLSVFGVGRPEMERIGHDKGLRVAYGTADMPGRRVVMEDALCTCRFEVHNQVYLLLGVCDGHGDHGLVSEFIATTVPQVLQEQLTQQNDATIIDWSTIWKTTCLVVDRQLKDKGEDGGSTGVFVLVTHDLLVVANVGDSRIILVREEQEQQEQQTTSEELESAVERMSLLDKDPNAPTTSSKLGVVPLTDDHKPNLPEEESRIKAAGMRVTEISFEEEGKTITVPKIVKSENDMMAVSRAFGDFEYKANTTLGPEEQAVICLPEVRVYPRSDADQYLIVACDGIWDICSNESVKDIVLEQIQLRKTSSDTILPEVGDALLLECLNLGSQDNLSTIVVALGDTANALSSVGKTLEF